MNDTIISTLITAICALLGTFCAAYIPNRKQHTLTIYRLDQLEKKVTLHNSVVERTYQLEKLNDIKTEQIKVINHRLEDLEHEKSFKS